jgi:hypothetical protein
MTISRRESQTIFGCGDRLHRAKLPFDASRIAWDTIYRLADKNVVKILGRVVKRV